MQHTLIRRIFFWGLTAFFLQACYKPSVKSESHNRECLDSSFTEKLQTDRPVKTTIKENIPLTGIIEPNPDKVIHFISLVGGIVTSTYFSLGDKVNRGEVLAEIKSSQLLELQSQVKTYAAQIKVAEKKLQSVQSMFDDGIASQKDLIEAQSELDVLKAEREKVNAILSLFSASSERGVFLIKSPATGIVTAKSITAGSQISGQGEPLFTISDLSEVWVSANVYATNVRNINTGMNVFIKTLSYPDDVFSGHISAISQVLDEESKVMKARIVLPNPELKLKPGMLVDVNVQRQLQAEALSIPTRALIFDDNKNYLVVYKNPCDIEIRNVEVHSRSNGITYILSGVTETDQVVISNQLLIYEKLRNIQQL